MKWPVLTDMLVFLVLLEPRIPATTEKAKAVKNTAMTLIVANEMAGNENGFAIAVTVEKSQIPKGRR